ncbi:heterokaryon incompatibility protein-domain-containing protein [Cercophora newfieldiana]|uniref:Heterokaryon incompatibility protein-domain-containing protein n=1 Tax=Cercophora newfieldiana TaxID=92897 RepID=A0AA40CQU8_9PEZI|nr:heterokaryon incompatibility protein-domain-containing protein [Cercophora newfieldiana]
MDEGAVEPPYQYHPLRYPDSVRILQLAPSASFEDPILCTLIAYRLSDPRLNFEPVSYTWGDASDRVLIHVGGNGACLSVTRNCFNTLKSLRQPDLPRLLWIDAICINQDDVAERSAQVRIMDKVYATGQQTLIYLGEATHENDMLFAELEAADSDLGKGTIDERSKPDGFIVQQLEELLERPWFQRVWVLQEVFLNDNRLVICGQRRCSWTALRSCLFGFGNNKLVVANDLPPVFCLHRWNADRAMPAWLNLWIHLNETRALLATNPKDKIFALKALLGRDQDDVNHLIDYRFGLPEVLTNLARSLLHSVGLVILSAIRSATKRSMASWVPDWSQTDSRHFAWVTLGSDEAFDFNDDGLLASDRRKYSYHFSIISSMGTPFPLLQVYGWRIGLPSVLGPTLLFQNLEDVRLQLSPILDRNKNLSGEGSGGWQPPLIEALRWLGNEVTSFISPHGLNTLGNTRTPDPALILTMNENVQSMGAVLHGRRFALVDQRDLAILPDAAQESDVLFLIQGNPKPCLLRESSGGRWSIVGGNCHYLSLGGDKPDETLRWCLSLMERVSTKEWDDIRDALGEPVALYLE